MSNSWKETLTVRAVSVGFTCLAFAAFKPLGMDGLTTMLYVHLLVVWILGVGVCYLTEAIMRHIVGMPASLDHGVDYIIKRNLRFQLINSPLEAIMMCAYLHLPMTTAGLPDPLSVRGIGQTVLLIAFCSFAIGLYWRFKFRSRYLEAELREVKALNLALQFVPDAPYSLSGEAGASSTITLTGSTSDTVTLNVNDLLFVEAVGNYVKVCYCSAGKVRGDMLRATSKQIEEALRDYPMVVRCHRAFLVNLSQVEQVTSSGGNMRLAMRHCDETVPVSRSHIATIKAQLSTIATSPAGTATGGPNIM